MVVVIPGNGSPAVHMAGGLGSGWYGTVVVAVAWLAYKVGGRYCPTAGIEMNVLPCQEYCKTRNRSSLHGHSISSDHLSTHSINHSNLGCALQQGGWVCVLSCLMGYRQAPMQLSHRWLRYGRPHRHTQASLSFMKQVIQACHCHPSHRRKLGRPEPRVEGTGISSQVLL